MTDFSTNTNVYTQITDGVSYRLKAPFDFTFLGRYGRVFTVLDAQDSGNICFGTDDGQKRYFVKYAGAPTLRAGLDAEEAIVNLKRSATVYRDLAHMNLVNVIDAEEIGGGYALIFDWVEGECMGKMYPQSRAVFMQLSMPVKKQIYAEILAFHVHVVERGYVAVDFYDGSIMYDSVHHKAVICDIDFYTKSPYVNDMGRMWGSSRFMSPEEFCLGADIDEVTNVYAMGATAFALFGDETDRRIEKWGLGRVSFDVAKRAVSDNRSERQKSIRQLIDEWDSASAARL